MKYITISGTIVEEYLEKFPGVKSLTLARKLYKDNPEVFTSIDNARTVIRYYRGTTGKYNRDRLSDRRFVRSETVHEESNPFDLPQSDALEYPIFKIPKAQNRIAILADAHAPYHDVSAITATMNWCKERDINAFLLSEWMDCHTLSRWEKDPGNRSFSQERDTLWRILDILQNEFPSAVFYYRQGNHEVRYESYMKSHALELFDLTDFQFDVLMRFGERGIIYIADKIRIRMGKLFSVHGHEFAKSVMGPVNPARGLFLKTKQSAICEHYHQTSEHSEPTLDGSNITCWSVGCLCELHPDYAPNNKWNHGFARVRVNEDDSFEVTNLRIHKGKVL